MEITFLGGVGTVTGSMYLIQTRQSRILLECGLFQGKRDESYARNQTFAVDPKGIDAAVLSHAHIDHSGNLPNLVKQGFGGHIFATHATRDLCAMMLPDSGRIHEGDVEYVNKKRQKQGLPPKDPLYTERDALRTLRQFVGIGYEHVVETGPGVRLRFREAGHILGSALVELEVDEGSGTKRLLFSGDLGQPDLPIVRGPEPLVPTDVLMIESTYGDRLHPTSEDLQGQLVDVVRRVAGRGGRIVIPAFAVGRTQEIVYHLHQAMHADELGEVRIFVDSPLALNVTEAFRMHPECYDDETRSFIMDSGDADPFGFGLLHYVRTVDESKALNTARNPLVIISASGMAEAGRVQHHLLHAVEDPRNAVLIAGWQAPNTLGRRIAERSPEVKIFGDVYPLRAEVVELYAYSAHADRDDLLRWAAPQASAVGQAYVVHGDPGPAAALAEGLRGLGYGKVEVPERGQQVTV